MHLSHLVVDQWVVCDWLYTNVYTSKISYIQFKSILAGSIRNLGIIVSYFAPDTNLDSVTYEFGNLLNLCINCTPIVLGGDFN